jgi:hypothetical protein
MVNKFSKNLQAISKFTLQKDDMKKILWWGSTHISRDCKKFSRPVHLQQGICAPVSKSDIFLKLDLFHINRTVQFSPPIHFLEH